jgi:hypothetical protein
MARSFASAPMVGFQFFFFGHEDSVSTLTWLQTQLLFVCGTTERNVRIELFKGEAFHQFLSLFRTFFFFG